MGDAIVRTQALTTVGRDSYDRLFKINLAQGYHPAGTSLIAPASATEWRGSDLDGPGFAGGHFRLSAQVAIGDADPARTASNWMLFQAPPAA